MPMRKAVFSAPGQKKGRKRREDGRKEGRRKRKNTVEIYCIIVELPTGEKEVCLNRCSKVDCSFETITRILNV